MRKALLISILFAGCVPTTYVADVHQAGDGTLVMTKCDFDSRGNPTSTCHDEDVGSVDSQDVSYPTDDTYYGTPDPAEIRHVAKQLAQKPAPRPAPTDATLAHAITSPGVARAIELCRSAYAPTAVQLNVDMTVAPSGAITALTTSAGDGTFGQCATKALRTANIPSFDGTESISTSQTLTL
ncbi:MAG: hypothetical protein QM831_05010 [Kofleriaceae bacterium]